VKRIDRRRFLRGAGGVAIALPFLSAMSDSVRAGSFPKRLVIFFTGLGQVKSQWAPVGTETDFDLGTVLQPLEAHKKDLLILEGIDMVSAYHGPGDPHQTGIGQALTGTELQEGKLFPYACNPFATVGWGGGISVDQFLGKRVGKATKFASLEFGVQVQLSNVSSRMSYAGPATPVPPDDDPWHVFDRIFSDLGNDPKELEIQRSKRRHVLDAIRDDYAKVVRGLGSDDKQKLENHLSVIEDIEQRLDAPGSLGGVCKLLDVGKPVDIYANDNYPRIGQLQLDLLAMSLGCDLTRVATVQWTTTEAGKVFTWLGQSDTHHALSHSGDSDAARRAQLVDIGVWHAQRLDYLINKLKAMPEGDGTVFDNTLIVWCTDISTGNTHSRRDMPYVLAGGCGGALKTGRYLKYAGDAHNDLLVSICHAMGVDVSTFGNPDYCTGPLSGLTA
jgi:hypothetical protein